jgi:hypothetical protein
MGGFMREHRLTDKIADCEYGRLGGAQLSVDLNKAAG